MMSTKGIRLLVLLAAGGFMVTGCEESPVSSNTAKLLFGNNNPNVIVAMGDSVTAGTEISGPAFPQLVAQMSGKNVINEGRGGAFSWDGVQRIGGVLSREQPGYVFILYGINDLIHGISRNDTIENLRQMIRVAKENHTYPIVATVPPRYRGNGLFNPNHEALNRLIRNLCKEENVRLADIELEFNNNPALLQADGFHPNEDGNLVIAMVFYEALR